MPEPASFDVELFHALRVERRLSLGQPLDYRLVTASTNDLALEAARADAPHGATFVAGSQSAGRGRRGNVWHSAAAENLLFSVLVRPRLEPAAASALTLAVGLAVRDALSPRLPSAPCVKWPNDVLYEDKKLAGVLVESQLQGSELRAVVIGVGLNVNASEFPAELAASATSLQLAGAVDRALEPLLADLLSAIAQRVDAYARDGIGSCLPELARADALSGRLIRVDALSGTARGIDARGRLLVEDDRGLLHAIVSGSVERLPG